MYLQHFLSSIYTLIVLQVINFAVEVSLLQHIHNNDAMMKLLRLCFQWCCLICYRNSNNRKSAHTDWKWVWCFCRIFAICYINIYGHSDWKGFFIHNIPNWVCRFLRSMLRIIYMKACSLLINMVPVTSSLDFMRNCRVDFLPNIVWYNGDFYSWPRSAWRLPVNFCTVFRAADCMYKLCIYVLPTWMVLYVALYIYQSMHSHTL